MATDRLMMKHIDEAILEHLSAFTSLLDERFRTYGAHDGLPSQLKDAVHATPRHRFVHRFRLGGSDTLQDFDTDPIRQLSVVYSEAVMNHVDAAGEPLPSSNSQPSYVLWLIGLLRPELGHHVFEIGSGSGWLAAVMARLVVDDGRVTGIEIIPDLAEQSRRDLAALGVLSR